MQLMTNLLRYRRQHPQAVHLRCDCFGTRLAELLLFDADPAKQSDAAVRRALVRADLAVEEIVDDQRRRPWEWPEEVRPETDGQVGDWLAVLAALERMPAFKARLRALGRSEKYRAVEREFESRMEEWRGGRGRRAVEMESRVDDVEETRMLMEGLVQRLISGPVQN
jgi:hypothetical protein